MTPTTVEAAAVVAALALVALGLRYLLKRLVGVAAGIARDLPGRISASPRWARLHPIRALFAAKCPRLYAFLGRRVSTGSFGGLPATLLVAAAAYLLFLLGGLAEEVVEAEEVVRFDETVNGLFATWRDTFLTRAFLGITELGATATLVAVVIVSTGFLWADRRPRFILPLWVCVVGSQSTTWLGKYAFDRTRPEFLTDATALSPSFPSAHATGALAVYGFIAYAIVRDLPAPGPRFEVVYWTSVLIALIAFSRMFLSVHFSSDVAAGLLVGAFWLLVGFGLAEVPRRRLAD